MRSEKALLSSRREFLANALGTAFVMGLLSPISAGQARAGECFDRDAAYVLISCAGSLAQGRERV